MLGLISACDPKSTPMLPCFMRAWSHSIPSCSTLKSALRKARLAAGAVGLQPFHHGLL
jgi:hypothetical protein